MIEQICAHDLYVTSTEIISTFTKLDLSPYSGIQECLEVCNNDDNCDAIGIKPKSDSEQIDCYINNGTGSVTLDSTYEVKVKEKHRPCKFTRLESFGICYKMKTTARNWNDAEGTCQALDRRAHLVSLETQEVSGVASLEGRAHLVSLESQKVSGVECQALDCRTHLVSLETPEVNGLECQALDCRTHQVSLETQEVSVLEWQTLDCRAYLVSLESQEVSDVES